jgi:hypothetical protein
VKCFGRHFVQQRSSHQLQRRAVVGQSPQRGPLHPRQSSIPAPFATAAPHWAQARGFAAFTFGFAFDAAFDFAAGCFVAFLFVAMSCVLAGRSLGRGADIRRQG